MNLLYKILKQDPKSREGMITTTSVLGIIVNLIISLLKIVIGTMVSSLAIVSEGINNATDATSSILTIVGIKLSAKHPTEKHPFGYGRIEYLTSLIVAGLILFAGSEVLRSAIDLMIHPAEMEVSVAVIVIIAISAVIKFFLGRYMIQIGKNVESDSLVGIGTESRNDSIISVITIASIVLYLVWDISIDAYVSLLTAVLVLKAGAGVLLSTVSNLLGKAGAHELAMTLYKEIRATEGISNAADLILHNYGPNSFTGSVNIEIDHTKTIGEVYEYVHELQLRIMHEYHVTMVFGIYAVDNKTEESRKMRQEIAAFVRAHKCVKSFHALYHDKKAKRIYCDFIVDYSKFDWKALEKEFCEYMKGLYPEDSVELTVETEFI